MRVFLQDFERSLIKRCQRRMGRGGTNKDVGGLEQVGREGGW